MAKLILFFFVLSLGASTWAADSDEVTGKGSASEKARTRLYDGGIDEQPLTVQQSLTEPRSDGSEFLLQKKILNATEEEEPEESNDETSSGF